MCFEHKTKMKIDCRIKNIKNVYTYVFIMYIVIFLWSMFSHEFSMFGHVHMFSFLVGYIQLTCDTKWCSPYYVCIMWKEMMKKIVNQYIYTSMFFLCIFSFWLKNSFDMCFDNLIMFYASNHYYITQDIWYQIHIWHFVVS
jgi:hypothetical protein